MAVRKITRRWLVNSFSVVVLIIVAAVAVAGWGVSSYHYRYVEETLASRADTTASIFREYAQDPTATDFSARVQAYVASFPLRSSMELMTIDGDGAIALTSSGFQPDESASALPDYISALNSGSLGVYTGPLGQERVMAVCLLLSVRGESSISAVRLVASLESVDAQIALFITLIIFLAVGIILLILFSSSYFISSIVNPIGQIGETARRIAGGDFNARLEKKTDDEIGELCDMINYMAEELDVADRLKNDFISSVSHELRTPLTAIQGWGETILADGGKDGEILERGMNIIIGETHRLSSMVEELLDFSRMQSGRLKLIRAKTDVIAELSQAADMYQERAKREGIGLSFEQGAELRLFVYGDHSRLRQVFINIIDNAIKYSDAGGSVEVRAVQAGDAVRIEVEDTGIGISREDISRVKNRFYKGNTTRRGSGIGLAVAEEIVSRHAGTLELSSVQGSGTTVTILLPLYKGEDLARIDAPQ